MRIFCCAGEAKAMYEQKWVPKLASMKDGTWAASLPRPCPPRGRVRRRSERVWARWKRTTYAAARVCGKVKLRSRPGYCPLDRWRAKAGSSDVSGLEVGEIADDLLWVMPPAR